MSAETREQQRAIDAQAEAHARRGVVPIGVWKDGQVFIFRTARRGKDGDYVFALADDPRTNFVRVSDEFLSAPRDTPIGLDVELVAGSTLTSHVSVASGESGSETE